jgi:hypothetical protein
MSDLQDHVAAAVKDEWKNFEQEHPRLAEFIDQSQLVAGAAAALRDDPEYAEAIGQATEIASAAESLGTIVRKFVGEWIKKIL